jgi:hypothetical protein
MKVALAATAVALPRKRRRELLAGAPRKLIGGVDEVIAVS